jgi:hypothetical protein
VKTPSEQRQLLADAGLVDAEEPKAEGEEREDGQEEQQAFYAALLGHKAVRHRAHLRGLGIELPPEVNPDADPARPQFDGGNREHLTQNPEHSLPKGVEEVGEHEVGWGQEYSIEGGASLLLGADPPKPTPPSEAENQETGDEHGRFLRELFGGGDGR